MLNLLKNNQTFVLILIPVVILGLLTRSFLLPVQAIPNIDSHAMPLYRLVVLLAGNHAWLSRLIALLMFIIQVLLIIKLNKDFILIEVRTYFHALIFILIGLSYTQLQQLHPVQFANIFILLAISKIFNTYRNETLFTNFFDAAFFISTGSLFYFNTIFLFIIIWTGLIIMRQFSFREWLLTFTGFITPYLFSLAYFYIYSRIQDLFIMIQSNFIFDKSYKIFNLYSVLYLIFLALIVILASINILKKYNKMKIGIRKFYKFFFWMFVYSLAIFFATPVASVEMLLITAIPLSFVYTNYLVSIKNEKSGNFLLLILIVLLVFMQIKG